MEGKQVHVLFETISPSKVMKSAADTSQSPVKEKSARNPQRLKRLLRPTRDYHAFVNLKVCGSFGQPAAGDSRSR